MIAIRSFKQVENKGTLKAYFSIRIEKWGGFYINDMCLFEKGNSRWITFPTRTYEIDGEKKYLSITNFEDPKMTKSFQEKTLQALDEYLKNSLKNEEKQTVPF